MHIPSLVTLCTAAVLAGAQTTTDIDPDVIDVDVAIIGGGASGAYAAVRLLQDYNKTVVVIEKENKLGGHVHVYDAGDGGSPVNYGVMAYLNRDTTAAFFKRFDVGLVQPDISQYIQLLLATKNVDFNTGKPVDVDYGPVDALGIPVDLAKYYALAAQYQDWFENGYFKTGDVPDDLLLPFGAFLRKHGLEGSLGVVRNLLSLTDAAGTLTWYVLALNGAPQLAGFGLGAAGPGFRYPATGSSQTLYDRVLDALRGRVLLNSTVVAAERSDAGITLTVADSGDAGARRTVRAKRLLVSATPSPGNVEPWGLDAVEQALFSRFSWERLYVAVVNGTGLPRDVVGLRSATAGDDSLHLPKGNFIDVMTRQQERDLWQTRIVGSADLTLDGARELVLRSLANLDAAGTYSVADAPGLPASASHGLGVPKVSAEDLKAGFYHKLYALQGHRNTFWTGLTFAPDYTPILWDYTEKILPLIVEGL